MRRKAHPLGEAVDVLLTREEAEHFIEEVRGDEAEVEVEEQHLRIEERELDPSYRIDSALAS